MAPNNFSEVHGNAFQTDTVSIRGPGKNASRHTQDALLDPPVTGVGVLAFDRNGRLVTVRVSIEFGGNPPIIPTDNNLMLIDQDTLEILDSVNLPAGLLPVNISYFYIDNLNRVVVPTPTQLVNIYAINQDQFSLAQSYNLAPTLLNPADVIVSVIPDSSGNLWFSSQLGIVGYIRPSDGQIFSTNLVAAGGNVNERINKSFATDENGGVIILSTFALYRFQVGLAGAPTSTWRSTYDRGNRIKPGQGALQGAGTTPTLFNDFEGNQFVAIVDNADPYMHVNVYNRVTGALVAQQEVFTKFPYATACFNSLIAVNHSIIVENNYGATGSGIISTTSGDRTTIPGLARVTFNPDTGASRVEWTNYDISIPSAISRLSTRNGLIYTYAKDELSWYFASVDFRTGEVCNKLRVSTTGILAGDLANNFYAGVGFGRNHNLYMLTLGGITVWRAHRQHDNSN